MLHNVVAGHRHVSIICVQCADSLQSQLSISPVLRSGRLAAQHKRRTSTSACTTATGGLRLECHSTVAESAIPDAITTTTRARRHFSHQANGLLASPARSKPSDPTSAPPPRKTASVRQVLRGAAASPGDQIQRSVPARAPSPRTAGAARKVPRPTPSNTRLPDSLELPHEQKRKHDEQRDRIERRYQLRIVRPLQDLHNELESLRKAAPSSKSEITSDAEETRFNAKTQWYDRKVLQPIANVTRQLEGSASIVAGVAERIRLLPHEVKMEWLDYFLQRIGRLARDLDASASVFAGLSQRISHTPHKARMQWLNRLEQMLEMNLNLEEVDLALQDHRRRIREVQRSVAIAAEQFRDEDEEKKDASGLHGRSKTKVMAYQRAVAETLQCLEDQHLISIRDELVHRAKWRSVVSKPLASKLKRFRTMITRLLPYNSPGSGSLIWYGELDSNFLKGEGSVRTRQALHSLLFAREEMERGVEAMKLLLHDWRAYDSTRYLLQHAPALAGPRLMVIKLFVSVVQINMQFQNISRNSVVAAILGTMRGTNKTDAVRYAKVIERCKRLSIAARDCDAILHEDFGRGLSLLALAPMSLLDRSLLYRFRPFNELLNHYDQLLGHIQRHRRNFREMKSDKVFRLVMTMSQHMQDFSRILPMAMFYSQCSDLYYGRHISLSKTLKSVKPPVQLHETSTIGLEALQAVQSLQISQQATLYPSANSIQIHYIQSMLGVGKAGRTLRHSRFLAVDAIVLDLEDGLRYTVPHVEILLLASEQDIFVVWPRRAGADFRRRGIWTEGLREILENPNITKIGFNIGSIRLHLSADLDVDMEGCVNLAGDENICLHPEDQLNKPLDALSISPLASVGLKKTHYTASVLLQPSKRPLEHFLYLAARAYVPLHLHSLQSQTSQGKDAIDHWHEACRRFGPIHMDRDLTDSKVYQASRLRVFSTSLYAQLDDFSGRLASSVLQRHQPEDRQQFRRNRHVYKERLKTYFLTTTFDEPFDVIRRVLGRRNENELSDRAIVEACSFAAAEFRLPFHQRHREYLQSALKDGP